MTTSTGPARQLGPWTSTYFPSYRVEFYKQGDPTLRVTNVDLNSIISISTSKTLQDIAGTFTITLKDARARWNIQEMDVVRIWLQGHQYGLTEVFRGVVDESRQDGSADTTSAEEDTIITGRCMAKYLQVNSMFLPVWDPKSLLPTVLTFGMGDVLGQAGQLGGGLKAGHRPAAEPKAIFEFLLKWFVFGTGTAGGKSFVGESSTPVAKNWIKTDRFEKVTAADGKPFKVPFIQFDEDTIDVALKRFEILGFTEAWVDELGSIVYRHPKWDAPVSFTLPTEGLQSWTLGRTDVGAYTYVEVVPAGNPGLASAYAQALMAGRAPVPSTYMFDQMDNPPKGAGGQALKNFADKEFVIETDQNGSVTDKGKQNRWFKLQQRLGLRPLQISSPLLFTPEDAQAQAQGLLQFMSRLLKTGSFTIPGEPVLRLGETIQIEGKVRGQYLNETFYIEGVQHSYTDGSHYTTTLQLTHGRDPWDPKWGEMVLPKYDSKQVATFGGIMPSGGTNSSLPTSYGGGGGGGGGGSGPGDIPAPESSQFRDPPASGPDGLGTFQGITVALWTIPMLQYAVDHGWTGHITSGYRPGSVTTSMHAGTQYPYGAIDFGGPGNLQSPGALNRAAFFAACAGFVGLELIPAQFPPYPAYPEGDGGHSSGTGH
jgi:hypothetical protein